MNLSQGRNSNFYFHTVDYYIFAAMLLLSFSLGLYFGYIRKRKEKHDNNQASIRNEKTKAISHFGSKSMNKYLLASRKLKPFPVALSLVSSYISGLSILSTPAEVYNFGTQYCMTVISILLMGFTVSTVYLPVFATLKIGSSYEYLEQRFNSSIRTIASVMFVIDQILFLPIILYVAALAFNQVTGANVYIIAGIACAVCVSYTVLGGIKAVVYIDAWQVIPMFLSVVLVATLGTSAMGGFTNVFQRANEGKRTVFFNFNPSMYERHTFWSVVIGGFTYWTSYSSVNQSMVQRYMSLPDLKKAKQSIAIFTIGLFVFVSVSCYVGVLMYSVFWDCDPKIAGLIKTDNQLFIMYVMLIFGYLRSIPGIFIAGIFGAALSSLSVVLNTTAGVLLGDIYCGCFKGCPSEKTSYTIVKGSTLILGVLTMVLLILVEQHDGILEVAVTFTAIASGITFGVFSLGMLVPWSNHVGAICGVIAGAFMSSWIWFGSQAAVAAGNVIAHHLDMSVDGCGETYGNLTSIVNDIDESSVFPLYRLSFYWINPIGIVSVLIVGSIASYFSGPRDLRTIDPDLISPVIHRFLPRECFRKYELIRLNSVEPKVKVSNNENNDSHTAV